ncbi:MAG: DinB family protein [Actinobacteria bacterium]|nr:DinB family protein [Actinomycetota bacterium]
MSTAENRAVVLLQEQVKEAIKWLEGVVADLTTEDAQWKPPGTALPAGAIYAHTVTSMDAVVNAILRGGPPMFAAAWAGKTGMSEQPPGPDPAHPGMPDWTAWSRRVTVDLAITRKYAGAVEAAVNDYLATLSDADLGRTIDLSAFGFGEVTVEFLLTNAVLGHAFSHGGEIACLKGMRGKKGSL